MKECIPINLDDIVEEELLNVIYDDYGSDTFDGLTMFEPSTDEFYIHINISRGNLHDSPKGRFTLAHELGHYLLSHHRLALMRGTMRPHCSINYLIDNESWKLEREADEFASSLLMPESAFKKYILGKKFDFQLLQYLAKAFNVSLSASALRFVELGNYPVMVVYAVEGRIRWVRRSYDFPFLRLRYGSEKNSRIPDNTVIGEYFFKHDESCCNGQEVVYAMDCFDTYCKDDNMREFYEWCIPYRNRALTVFWEK